MTTLSVLPPNESPEIEDISLDASGNLEVATEVEDVRQRVVERLRYWFGEWFLAQRDGIPYKTAVFPYRLPTTLIETMIVSEAAKVEGVREISESSTSIDPDTRVLTITMRGKSDYGNFSISQLTIS